MKKRTMLSFKSWAEAEKHDLEEIRKTTPEERLKILYELILLQKVFPKEQIEKIENEIPVIYRTKKQ